MTQLITQSATKYVYAFSEGGAGLKDLLRGKGANLAEMTRLDYVSCSPYRVPVARLEAGRCAVTAGGSDSR